ncbi:MAG TPA: ester cyclase [Solirubrobacteraceae bacterium]|nr:ester cyclase [Solirubrobacteraceae bacterium]
MNTPRDALATVIGLREEVMHAQRPDLAHQFMHPQVNVTRTGMSGAVAYLAGLGDADQGEGATYEAITDDKLKRFEVSFGEVLKSFPDMRHEVIGPELTDGETVISHIKFVATHAGDFRGVPATNNRIEFDEVVIHKVVDGLVTEVWAFGDELSLLQQIGVIPATASS